MKSKKEWYLPKDLAGIGGLSPFPSNVTRKARQEGWIKREAKGIKGGGFEFHYSSLPDKVQRALGFLKPLTKEVGNPITPSQEDLQKRIDQLENKLQALETKAQGFVLPKPPEGLTNDEWQLVCAFRRCNEDRQVGLLATAEALAAQTEKEEKESTEIFKDHQVA
ncbi:ci repressor-like protein [Mergibacter septicus]|uniref:Ci repressor-like protein n=1 Tax=Mergibacter septicus TaxID=221402 RepID=A0A8D4IZR1_9PAST|nr:DNA-binding protein [Mergibacter septicus]AWX15207.1 ci repressor-like protein [Mergibacter septicus]QDJ14461.1 ci repressor-like protein [Mergibacter septicus]UTU48102.1 ci repressor-like protein [Mergibacter septicus]WMR96285.1 DNA-binding protein [Mergibacter septicus]